MRHLQFPGGEWTGPMYDVVPPHVNCTESDPYWNDITLSFDLSDTTTETDIVLSMNGTDITLVDALNSSAVSELSYINFHDNGGGGSYGAWIDNIRIVANPIPEPSTLVLLGCAFLGLAAYAWRKRK